MNGPDAKVCGSLVLLGFGPRFTDAHLLAASANAVNSRYCMLPHTTRWPSVLAEQNLAAVRNVEARCNARYSRTRRPRDFASAITVACRHRWQDADRRYARCTLRLIEQARSFVGELDECGGIAGQLENAFALTAIGNLSDGERAQLALRIAALLLRSRQIAYDEFDLVPQVGSRLVSRAFKT